uniref:Mce/MlaD domain-containing protein n=1 Tax=Thuretia quercifolia TaxID=189650 RepID=A0A1Z1MJZ9_9FLOR|nr:hypothetical protein [Thuretia quercifolia]ARW66373.1 hypothetical protein [Thuretia quercifolia]
MSTFSFKFLFKYIQKFFRFFIFLLFFFTLFNIINTKKKKGYLLFIEFNHVYGVKQGTNVNFRGIQVGYVKKIYMKINSIVLLVHIQSSKTLLPKTSCVETNQIGLFNNTVIDIIPLRQLKINFKVNNKKNFNVFDESCWSSKFLCNRSYLQGNRGLNYDDLVRAATRVSQRFDDPRFFSLFYLFLQNTLDLSDDILSIIKNVSYLLYLCSEIIEIYLQKYIF